MTFNYLLFDFDGTLVDTAGKALTIYNRICGRYGLKKIEDSEIESIKKLSAGQLVKYLKIGALKLPFLIFELKFKLAREMKDIPLIKDSIREVLEDIKNRNPGLIVGIVTSNWKKNVKKFLKLNGMDLFDFIHASGAYEKKHRKINKVMKKYAMDREKTLYIGDEIRDIIAARKSGIKIVAVTWGYNDVEVLKDNNSDFIIKEPEELVGIVC
ncbi:MAG: HAD-IA family hydrolase [Spirochaetales bacterium]|nr:HAD-IA family hydrolase [Spirochaetales bacterium]